MLVFLNLIYAIGILGFIIYSIFRIGKELFADLKHPYLGFASTYLINYFFSCLIILLIMLSCFLFISTGKALDRRLITFYYCLHIYSLYNGSLFLIKKYNFSNIKNEILLTTLLQFFCFSSILTVCCLPQLKVSLELSADSYPEILFLLFGSFGNKKYFLFSNCTLFNILILLKALPISILAIMWVKSIGKSYNKKTHSYFVKSANHPILFFLLYQFILINVPFFNFDSLFEITVLTGLLFTFKAIFSRKVLFWLRHKDMEEIETKAILRSNTND